jgi:hypothetical protein
MVESGVKSLSKPVFEKLEPTLGQLDDFACRQLDKVWIPDNTAKTVQIPFNPIVPSCSMANIAKLLHTTPPMMNRYTQSLKHSHSPPRQILLDHRAITLLIGRGVIASIVHPPLPALDQVLTPSVPEVHAPMKVHIDISLLILVSPRPEQPH